MIGRMAALAAALMAGCTSVAPGAGSLAETTWRVTAVNGRTTPQGPVAYSMTFESRRLGARFGCNIIGGSYRVRGATLHTDAMLMTEMDCGEPAATFEAQGSAILLEPLRIDRSDGRMTLGNARGRIDLQRTY